MKFARSVQFQIKNGKDAEFRKLFVSDVLPLLREQEGFREELTLVNRDRVLGISLWENRNSSETYQKATYPQILETLKPVIEGTPRVETYEVATSTPQHAVTIE